MGIIQKRAFVIPFPLKTIDFPNGQVHLGHSPGGLVAFLTENGDRV
jgi:hypothetical protein